MTLYEKLKSALPGEKNVLSDSESILLNRKDYHLTQISPVNALISQLGVRISYPYRVLLSFIDQISSGLIKDDFNIVISDPSVALAGFYGWVRAGGGYGKGKVYAPKGIGKMPSLPGLVGELLTDFFEHADTSANSKPTSERLGLFTIVLGNTKSGNQTIFAADRYTEIKQGILILKDYARTDAFDEREYLESKNILPAITFEGHAFSLKT